MTRESGKLLRTASVGSRSTLGVALSCSVPLVLFSTPTLATLLFTVSGVTFADRPVPFEVCAGAIRTKEMPPAACIRIVPVRDCAAPEP